MRRIIFALGIICSALVGHSQPSVEAVVQTLKAPDSFAVRYSYQKVSSSDSHTEIISGRWKDASNCWSKVTWPGNPKMLMRGINGSVYWQYNGETLELWDRSKNQKEGGTYEAGCMSKYDALTLLQLGASAVDFAHADWAGVQFRTKSTITGFGKTVEMPVRGNFEAPAPGHIRLSLTNDSTGKLEGYIELAYGAGPTAKLLPEKIDTFYVANGSPTHMQTFTSVELTVETNAAADAEFSPYALENVSTNRLVVSIADQQKATLKGEPLPIMTAEEAADSIAALAKKDQVAGGRRNLVLAVMAVITVITFLAAYNMSKRKNKKQDQT